MKKVIEKLNRVLSMLLVAALVVGSVPEMSLVARAAEESTVDESTTVPESSELESTTEAESTTESESTTTPETTDESTNDVEAAKVTIDWVSGKEKVTNPKNEVEAGKPYTFKVAEGYIVAAVFDVDSEELIELDEDAWDVEENTCTIPAGVLTEGRKIGIAIDAGMAVMAEDANGEPIDDGGVGNEYRGLKLMSIDDAKRVYTEVKKGTFGTGWVQNGPDADDMTIFGLNETNGSYNFVSNVDEIPYYEWASFNDKDTSENKGNYAFYVIMVPDDATNDAAFLKLNHDNAGQWKTFAASDSDGVSGEEKISTKESLKNDVRLEEGYRLGRVLIVIARIKKETNAIFAWDWDGGSLSAKKTIALPSGLKLEEGYETKVKFSTPTETRGVCDVKEGVTKEYVDQIAYPEIIDHGVEKNGKITIKADNKGKVVPYITGWKWFGGSDTKINSGHYAAIMLEVPDEVTPNAEKDVIGITGTGAGKYKLGDFFSDVKNGEVPKKGLLIIRLDNGTRSVITINWDGLGNLKADKETYEKGTDSKYRNKIYEIDWSGIQEAQAEKAAIDPVVKSDKDAAYNMYDEYGFLGDASGDLYKNMIAFADMTISGKRLTVSATKGYADYIKGWELFHKNYPEDQEGTYVGFLLHMPESVQNDYKDTKTTDTTEVVNLPASENPDGKYEVVKSFFKSDGTEEEGILVLMHLDPGENEKKIKINWGGLKNANSKYETIEYTVDYSAVLRQRKLKIEKPENAAVNVSAGLVTGESGREDVIAWNSDVPANVEFTVNAGTNKVLSDIDVLVGATSIYGKVTKNGDTYTIPGNVVASLAGNVTIKVETTNKPGDSDLTYDVKFDLSGYDSRNGNVVYTADGQKVSINTIETVKVKSDKVIVEIKKTPGYTVTVNGKEGEALTNGVMRWTIAIVGDTVVKVASTAAGYTITNSSPIGYAVTGASVTTEADAKVLTYSTTNTNFTVAHGMNLIVRLGKGDKLNDGTGFTPAAGDSDADYEYYYASVTGNMAVNVMERFAVSATNANGLDVKYCVVDANPEQESDLNSASWKKDISSLSPARKDQWLVVRVKTEEGEIVSPTIPVEGSFAGSSYTYYKMQTDKVRNIVVEKKTHVVAISTAYTGAAGVVVKKNGVEVVGKTGTGDYSTYKVYAGFKAGDKVTIEVTQDPKSRPVKGITKEDDSALVDAENSFIFGTSDQKVKLALGDWVGFTEIKAVDTTAGAADVTGVTYKYIKESNAAKAAEKDWITLNPTSLKKEFVSDEWYLVKVTTSTGVITKVMKDNSGAAATEIKSAGAGIWRFQAGASMQMKVVVETSVGNHSTITVNKKDNVKVSYSVFNDDTHWVYLEKGANTIPYGKDNSGDHLTNGMRIRIEADDHYTVSSNESLKVFEYGKTEPQKGTYDTTTKTSRVTISSYDGKGLTISAEGSIIENTYNITKTVSHEVIIEVMDSYGTITRMDGTADKSVKVADGEKFYVRAKAVDATKKINEIKLGSGGLSTVSDDPEWQYVITSGETSDRTITATTTTKGSATVTIAAGAHMAVKWNVTSGVVGETVDKAINESNKAVNIGQTVKFKIGQEMTPANSTPNYIPTEVYYQYVSNGEKFPLKNVGDGIYELEVTDETKTAYILSVNEKINEATAKTANFTYNKDMVSSVQFGATPVTDKVMKFAGDTTAAVYFTVTPVAGYSVKTVTIGGTEVESSGGSWKLDFGESRTADIVIEMKAEANGKLRKFVVENRDPEKITYEVETGDGVLYSSASEKYTVKSTTDVVRITATVPYRWKIAAAGVKSNGTTPVKVAEAGRDDSDKKTVKYTFEIAAGQMEEFTATGKENKITLTSAADVKNVSVVNNSQKQYEVRWDVNSFKSTVGFDKNIIVGTNVVITLSEDQKLLVDNGEKDGAGNAIYEQVVTNAYGEYEFTVSEGKSFKIESTIEKPAYLVTVKVDNKEQAKNIWGTTARVNAVAGNTITITATTNASSPAEVDFIAMKPEGVTWTPGISADKKTLTATLAKDDAGKTVVIPLRTDNGIIASVDVVVSPEAEKLTASVNGSAITDGGTVEVNAGQKLGIKVASVPEGVDSTLYKQKTEKLTFDEKTGLWVYGVHKAGTEKVEFTDKAGKTLFWFNIKTNDPDLKMKLTSTSQGASYVNLSMEPGKNVAYAENMFYEIVSKPKTGTGKPAGAVDKVEYIKATVDESISAKAVKFDVAKANTNGTLNEKLGWTYDITARLVIGKDDLASKTTVATDLIAAGEKVPVSVTTKDPYIAEKITLSKKNSGTAYTGKKTVVAAVKFDGKASTVGNASAVVLNTDGSALRTGQGTCTAAMESGTTDISVTPLANMKPGSYLLRVFADGTDETKTADKDAYRATAELTFKVVAGAGYIDDSTIPGKITKKADKNVSVTLKATAYTNDTDKIKAKSQKIVYEVVGRNGQTFGTDTQDQNVKNNVEVKGSKLTIKKDFVVGSAESSTFNLKMYADGYEDSATIKQITVTTEYAVPETIVLKDAGNNTLGTTLDYAQANGAEVIVEDKEGNDITNDVTLTPASGKAYVDSNTNRLRITGATKSVTLKAVTRDGGKKSASLKLKLDYAKPNGLRVEIPNAAAAGIDTTGSNIYRYSGSSETAEIDFAVMTGDNEAANGLYYNWTVSVSGATKTRENKAAGTFSVMPTAKDTVITVVDKSLKKDNKTVVRLTNETYNPAKAPKTTLAKGSVLYAGMINSQTLKYTVNKSDYNAVQLVQVSAPKDVSAGIGDGVYEVENGTFELTSTATSSKTGTVKYSIIYGSCTDGNTATFVPATKAASLSIKLTKVKKFKLDQTYVLNYVDSNSFELTGTPKEAFISLDTELRNVKVGGKAKSFTKYFRVDDSKRKIVFNPGTTKIKDISKDDLTGYVTYRYSNGNGVVTETKQITVALSDEHREYGFDISPVMAAAKVSVAGTIKEGSAALADLKSVESATSGWNAKLGDAGTGKFTLESTQTVKPGTQTVKLKIARNSSAVAAAESKFDIEVQFEVLDPKTSDGKVTDLGGYADLGAENAGQAWSAEKKTVIYSMDVPIEKALKVNVQNLTISSVKEGTDAPEGFYVAKKEVNGAVTALTVSVYGSKATGGQEKAIPVTIGFDRSSVAETITLRVKTPAVIKNMDDIKSDIEAYLSGKCYTSLTGDAAKADVETQLKTNILNKEMADIKTLKYEKETGAEAGAVTLTIVNRIDANDTRDIGPVTIRKNAYQGTVQASALEVMRWAKNKLLSETEESVPEGSMKVSATTTASDIGEFLKGAITNDDYSILIQEFSVTEPEIKETGEISFKFTIVGPKGNSIQYGPVTKTLKGLEETTGA